MYVVKVQVDIYDCRNEMILALAKSGYKVWEESKWSEDTHNDAFFVCFEVKNNEVMKKKDN